MSVQDWNPQTPTPSIPSWSYQTSSHSLSLNKQIKSPTINPSKFDNHNLILPFFFHLALKSFLFSCAFLGLMIFAKELFSNYTTSQKFGRSHAVLFYLSNVLHFRQIGRSILYLSPQGKSMVVTSGLQEALGSNKHLQPDTGRMTSWRKKKKRWSRWKLRNKSIIKVYEQEIGNYAVE